MLFIRSLAVVLIHVSLFFIVKSFWLIDVVLWHKQQISYSRGFKSKDAKKYGPQGLNSYQKDLLGLIGFKTVNFFQFSVQLLSGCKRVSQSYHRGSKSYLGLKMLTEGRKELIGLKKANFSVHKLSGIKGASKELTRAQNMSPELSPILIGAYKG